jgi:molybdenum cofactor cytidylyltransferase
MGAALAAAVRATSEADGWLVALGDMPWIDASTYEAVARQLDQGAELVAPFYRGKRGHPVGFGMAHREALAALDGDAGARGIFSTHTPFVIEVDDQHVLLDVDLPSDLGQG